MDPSNTSRTSLPPIQYLTEEKGRRHDPSDQARYGDSHEGTSAPYVQPLYHPVGPPPPYSASNSYQPLTSTSRTWTPSTGISAPYSDIRSTAAEPTKRLLPSLSEALGVSSGSNAIEEGGHGHPSVSSAATSSVPRRFSAGPSPTQPSPRAFSQREAQPSAEASRHWLHEANPSASHPGYTSHPAPAAPPSVYSHKGHLETSPKIAREQSSYGRPIELNTAQPATQTSAPMMHPSIAQSGETWRAGNPATSQSKPQRTSHAYSESVKRHLDFYDFELALNEISEQSAAIQEFGRQYSIRLHQSQRTGITSSTLPSTTEIDDMLARSRQQLEAFGRMKDVLLAHQAARLQQSQQQSQAQDNRRNDSLLQQEESKDGGFAGGEPKKRRGRNAAPGRCHSCNRAETPEWRRGPDGARTLCNACGLHYAKLTRKAGVDKASIGNSSLRPKAREEASDA